MPKQYLKEQRDRAIKMVLDLVDGYRPLYAAGSAIGLNEMKVKVWDLDEVNETLKRASIFFASQLDPRHS